MMTIKIPALLLLLTLASFANAQVKAGTMLRTKVVEAEDSVVFYETDVATRQKSYMDILAGTWIIQNMKTQSQKNLYALTGVELTLNKDSSFTGNASCNKISGKFTVRGTSIRFVDIVSTRKTCAKQDEENTFIQLLREAVSNYSVTKPSLVLRNGSGVAVFEATRR